MSGISFKCSNCGWEWSLAVEYLPNVYPGMAGDRGVPNGDVRPEFWGLGTYTHIGMFRLNGGRIQACRPLRLRVWPGSEFHGVVEALGLSGNRL